MLRAYERVERGPTVYRFWARGALLEVPGPDNDRGRRWSGDETRFSVLAWMRRHNIAITRERFISINWMGSPPDPRTPEDEEQLPPELQDWEQFERPRRKRGRRR
jgi:hypothetical protein